MRSLVEPKRSRSLCSLGVLVLAAAGVGGCSSDISRFNESPFASRPAPANETTGSIPTQPTHRVETQALPPPRVTQNGSPGIASYQPQPQYAPPAQYAPPPQAQYAPQPQYAPPRQEVTGSIPPAPPARQDWSWDGGTAVTVAQGETLESISRRYGVPVHAIMQANNMTPPAFIQAGQRLVIPRSTYSKAPAASPPATRLAANPGYKPALAPAPQGGVHVVQPGETLYSLARRYHKQPMLIAQANNFGLDHKIKIGDRVVIPGAAPVAPVAAAKPVRAPTPQHVAELKPKPQPAVVRPQGSPGVTPAPTAHTITPTQTPPAETAEAAPQHQAETTSAVPSFRWPARGRVILGFGPKTSGGQNDGINVSVPEGTPIRAAEDGVVAYAGNELKGYGNLVLIRHANGFVTAYAHASELAVKKGETVKRGQIIGKSGATGNVTAPQLHFEVRKGATPVDPMQYLQGG
jgi:murein DD-endopeptidase MepM/ murein hydrolase activator NlpD